MIFYEKICLGFRYFAVLTANAVVTFLLLNIPPKEVELVRILTKLHQLRNWNNWKAWLVDRFRCFILNWSPFSPGSFYLFFSFYLFNFPFFSLSFFECSWLCVCVWKRVCFVNNSDRAVMEISQWYDDAHCIRRVFVGHQPWPIDLNQSR